MTTTGGFLNWFFLLRIRTWALKRGLPSSDVYCPLRVRWKMLNPNTKPLFIVRAQAHSTYLTMSDLDGCSPRKMLRPASEHQDGRRARGKLLQQQVCIGYRVVAQHVAEEMQLSGVVLP